ncbi:allene oxide cyclase barrel-like domain-containing protein [Streptomyces silvisoli]|uniref:Allene oxide cyclase barrel-like domain-containing protein n=1 Tax=Streptomyces silvisoli TaxID=3034235 RepID=A0ABT5ZVV1_9ACTN|nr:hypothetical protein [Streptomyces silvisoli]MDF3293937.1 hypothetical protein [Streptomyces silvisoli]
MNGTDSALPVPSTPAMCPQCLAALDGLAPKTAPAARGGECFIQTHLAENADIRIHSAASSARPTVGDRNSHSDKITDASGRVVGTITGSGWKVYERAHDGHVLSYYREEIEFADGTVQTSGWMDSTAVWAGEWQSLHAVGTGGAYLGLIGVRQIRQEIPRELFRANIILCASGGR